MLTQENVESLLEEEKTLKSTLSLEVASIEPTPSIEEISTTKRAKTFNDVFFSANTGNIAHKLLSFLGDKDRASFKAVSVDARRLTTVDEVISQNSFKVELMQEILGVLDDERYASQLSVSRNPSGFLRLNNDLIKLIKNQDLLKIIPDAAELRLNFWPGDLYQRLGAKLEPETQHTHPRGFCSFIVTGGYIHNIYLPSDNRDDKAYKHVVHGVVSPSGKSFEVLPGTQYLAHVKAEEVKSSSDYAYFSTGLTHEVAERIKAKTTEEDVGTLSINVVFKPLESAKQAEYTLYLNEASSLVEEYPKLSAELAYETLEIVKGLLRERIAALMAPIDEKTTEVKAETVIAPVSVSTNRHSLFDSFEETIAVLNDEDKHLALPAITPITSTETADDADKLISIGTSVKVGSF